MITSGSDILAGHVQNTAPVGALQMYAGPAGTASAVAIAGTGTSTAAWLFCTGTAVSRAVYASLFLAIGTTYGAGDGSTTFNLPDLRGRIPVGSGQGAGDGRTGTATGTPTGTALANRIVGEWGGEQQHTLVVSEIPAHSHTIPTNTNSANIGSNSIPQSNQATNSTVASNNSTGGDGAHNNNQPFLVVNFIIRSSYN